VPAQTLASLFDIFVAVRRRHAADVSLYLAVIPAVMAAVFSLLF
jgi:hypothetical protein